MTNLKNYGRLIKKRRLDLKLNVEQVARKSEIDVKQLKRIEAGGNALMKTYIRVCNTLGLRLVIENE